MKWNGGFVVGNWLINHILLYICFTIFKEIRSLTPFFTSALLMANKIARFSFVFVHKRGTPNHKCFLGLGSKTGIVLASKTTSSPLWYGSIPNRACLRIGYPWVPQNLPAKIGIPDNANYCYDTDMNYIYIYNHIVKCTKFFLWNTPHQIVGWITVCFRIAFIYLAGETSPCWVNSRLGIRSMFHPRDVSSEVLDPQTGWIWWSAQRAPSYRSGGSWAPRAEDKQVRNGWGIGRGILWNGCDFCHFDPFCIFFFRECHLDVIYVQAVWLCIFPFKDTIKCHLSIYGGFLSLLGTVPLN